MYLKGGPPDERLNLVSDSKPFTDGYCVCYQGGHIEQGHTNWEWGKVVFVALKQKKNGTLTSFCEEMRHFIRKCTF